MIKLLKKLTKKDMALAGLAFLLILATGLSELDHAGLYVRYDSACSDRGEVLWQIYLQREARCCSVRWAHF